MKLIRPSTLVILAALSLVASAFAQAGFPFQDEGLHYTINYPSGLSLGESTLTAHRTARGWDFAVSVDANVGGFAIKDLYSSSVTSGFCSLALNRDISHCSKQTREQTTFDQEKGVARRATVDTVAGGRSEMDVGACARDAIALVYFARKELGQGRVPQPQRMYFGSAYAVSMEYTGAQNVTLADRQPEVADHLAISVKGPKSDFSFDVFYARDAARTPLLIKVPQSAGSLSMELVR